MPSAVPGCRGQGVSAVRCRQISSWVSRAVVCSAACRAHGASLIVGVGTNDTAAAIATLRELAQSGDVAAALVPTPPYTRPGEAGTPAHFTALAEHGGLPLVVYDIPYRTGQPLSPGTLNALRNLPQVVGGVGLHQGLLGPACSLIRLRRLRTSF